uniref:Large ribosomal subunit protein uL6 n=1 Tax=uncultured Microgenomates bacterium Rifle_16ft_4_minimus_38077 TaxID=1665117 RepID=A0A0H4T6V7_9BACT|nr:50S ribosomal protein L6, large subunit ribosomal protein L6 [uncultured Microgenomates bacterium Rifle_16ft_4_minimus_38077]
MSRIGKMPILIPAEVKVEISGKEVFVSGPKGNLNMKLPYSVEVKIEGNFVKIVPKSKGFDTKAIQGTIRSIIANMVKGVADGWTKKLELVGTGYRAELSGKKLVMSIGYSHPVEVTAPEGISFEVEKTQITVLGADRHLVGQLAAKIRDVRPPEPYKGKGIMYQNEVVRRKPGKAAKAQPGAA